MSTCNYENSCLFVCLSVCLMRRLRPAIRHFVYIKKMKTKKEEEKICIFAAGAYLYMYPL